MAGTLRFNITMNKVLDGMQEKWLILKWGWTHLHVI